jgi:cysteine desulfurase
MPDIYLDYNATTPIDPRVADAMMPSIRISFGNPSSVSFKGLEANAKLADLDGVAASAGAACHSDRIDVSPVLRAMNVPIEHAMGTIRLSVGRYTTTDEIDSAVEQIGAVVGALAGV